MLGVLITGFCKATGTPTFIDVIRLTELVGDGAGLAVTVGFGLATSTGAGLGAGFGAGLGADELV